MVGMFATLRLAFTKINVQKSKYMVKMSIRFYLGQMNDNNTDTDKSLIRLET